MRGLQVACLTADARRLAPIGSFALVIAPMQFLQIIGGAAGRAELLAGVAACLRPGGTFAAAIADLDEAIAAEDAPPPVPDVGQRGNWIYSSLPLDVRPEPGGVAVEWLRQIVSPAGDLTEERHTQLLDSLTPDELEREAAGHGLRQIERLDRARDGRLHREHGGGMPTLRVCSLYPELMNIYADRGNIAVLRARCEWRGFGFEHAAASLGEPLDPDAHDLFYMGGGQDRDQVAVAHDMAATKREALHAAADRGAVVLAVCGGYQLLGHSYELGGEELPGVGLVDLHTVREPGARLIGNCAIEADLGTGPRVIAGFENHGGRTYLGPEQPPLGRVLAGHGNNGRDGFEGVHRDNVIGTYLHGPLLPKNVWLADRLVELALGIDLEPLADDELEAGAHASARRAAGV